MRHDPIEIGLASKAVRRRGAKRMLRTILATQQPAAAGSIPATDALDEAFAGMSRDERRPRNLAVVTQLAEQLEALDRQREQLARLLRDIEVTTLVD